MTWRAGKVRQVEDGHASGPGQTTILIARGHDRRRPCGMGAKYLPSIKDQKASQRFQRKQAAQVRPTKMAGAQVVKPVKKK